MWQSKMKPCLVLVLVPLIVHGFAPPQSPTIRTRLSIRSNPMQSLRRPRRANSIPSSSLLQAAEDPSSVPTPPTSTGNVDLIQQTEQAREQLQLQLKEAETRRIQLQNEIQNNAANVQAGKQNLQSSLKQNENDIQELKQLQKLAKKKFNLDNIQFPTLETIAQTATQVPTATWAGTVVGASLGGFALARINLQKRRKLQEEQEMEQRLAEAESSRNAKIAQANANRDRFLVAGSTLVVGTAVTALAQFGQNDSVPTSNKRLEEQSIVKNSNQRPDAASVSRSNGPSPDLPYLEQKIQKAEDQVKNSQQTVQNAADTRKKLQVQLAQEAKFKRELTEQLEQTEESIRQANLAKERFEMESQLNTRRAAVDILAAQSPQSSLSEKVAAGEQAKKEVQMAEAQRLAAFAETQRIGEMEQKVNEEVAARMQLLQKLQSTEASLQQANDRAKVASLEAQLARETNEQALAQATATKDKVMAEAMASKDKALAEAKAEIEKALAEKQRLEQQAAAERQKAQLAALETQKVAESKERAMAQVLASDLMAAEAKGEAEEKARIAMQLQQQQKSRPQDVANTFLSSIQGAVASKADLVDTKGISDMLQQGADKVSSIQGAVASKADFVDTKKGLSDMLQQGADTFQVKRDETALVTRAAVDELLASTRATTKENVNAFRNMGTAVDELLASAKASTNENVNAFRSSPMGMSLAVSVGDENVPTAAAAIIGSGVAATGFVAAAIQNSKKNGSNALAQTATSNPLQSYTPVTSPVPGADPASNPFQPYSPSQPATKGDSSFFTSKDPRTYLPGQASFFNKNNKKRSSASKETDRSFFTSKEPRTDLTKSKQTNFFTKLDSFKKTPPGFLSTFGGRSSKGKGQQMSSVGKDKLQDGGSSKRVKAASSVRNRKFGAATASVVPVSTTASPPASPKFGTRNGSSAPSFGSPKGSSPLTSGGFKGSNSGFANGSKVSGFASNSPSFGASESSPSFGRSNSSNSPNAPAAPKSGLSSTSFGAPKGSTVSATSPAVMESKGQSNVAGFGDRNGMTPGTLNNSAKGLGAPSPSSSNSVAAPKGFSPYGNKGASKSNASSTKGSTQSSFNPSNSPFGNGYAASLTGVGSSSTTTSPPSNSFSPGNTSSGTAQSNQSFNRPNPPFGSSTGTGSNGVPLSSTNSAMRSKQSSLNPPNSPFGSSNAAQSAGLGSWSTETSTTSKGGYNRSNTSSGAAQSSSFNPSNSPFGNSNGATTTGGDASRRAESAGKGYGVAPAHLVNNPLAGASQSSQSASNPSNSPYGNNNGAATNGAATSGNIGPGLSTGYNPSNPSVASPQSMARERRASIPPAGTSNQGINQGAMGRLNQTPSSGGPNSASLTQASSSNPGPRLSDTSGDEQQWRESKPNQGDWWNVEKRDYFTTLGRREERAFAGQSLRPSSNIASSYSPFGNSNQQSPPRSSSPPPSSLQSYSAPPNQGKGMDTNQEEQEWRDTSSPGSQWFETERIDHYTDRGVRVTRSFSPNGASTSSMSSYSPFSQQNSQTTASIPPASGASSAIAPQIRNSNNYNNPASPALDANQSEQRWRESSAAPGGQWFEQEKLDFYTSRGTRATRSFNGGGTTEDVAPNYNVNGKTWQ